MIRVNESDFVKSWDTQCDVCISWYNGAEYCRSRREQLITGDDNRQKWKEFLIICI